GCDGSAAATAGYDNHLAADLGVARRRSQKFDRFHEFVVGVRTHDAGAAQQRRDDLSVADQRASMRADHHLAGGRTASLEGDDRLSLLVRAARRLQELARVLELLDD